MIAGIFYQGSGLNNQLFRYLTARVTALDKGYEWGMFNPELFKGASFMKLDMGIPVAGALKRFDEKKVVENGVDIRSYDPEINFIEDGTIIDGEFQDERYWGHRLNEIREWLKVEPLEMPDDLCVINLRGTEYRNIKDLYLPKEYWQEALKHSKAKRFEVHTDDPQAAREIFPDFPIVDSILTGHCMTTSMGLNWRAVRYAKHLIISNSSFAVLPALLNENVEEIIAPRYWARRNIKVWAMPQNYYKKFTYI